MFPIQIQQMKKNAFIILALCATAIISGVTGYLKGRQSAFLEDFKTYSADLISLNGFPENQKLELRDFLKARYYYIANKMPESYLGVPYDYGNVDFHGLTIGKGPTAPKHEYQLFKARKVQFREPKAQP
jgi:hypothetical protein